MAKDYSKLEKDDLLKVIEQLESRKKYGLIWDEEKTKEEFEKESENALPVLKEVKGKEIKTDPAKPTNILIEGDNYHALSVLNYTHQGKIDVIYIDPPYNTGKKKEWKYNDCWIDKEDTYRHSKWLSFMSKRLRLAKNLLKDEGVIFISIDDNEIAQLRLLCSEIFGEQNFIASFKWNRVLKAPSLSGSVRTKYEYVLAYCKGQRIKLFGKSSYNTQGPLWHLPNKRNLLVFPAGSIKIKQTFKKGNYGGTYKVELLDDMIKSNDYNKNVVRIKAHSAWGQAKIDKYVEDGFTFEIKKNPTTLYTTLSSEGNYIAPSDLITDGECGVKRNTEASEAMKAMGISFDYPKPVSLIKYLVNMVTHDKRSAVVVDFFAGSGTTGHAVLELNANGDTGNRQFILCTNNEDNNGSGKKIAADVCYPRIQKAIKGYKTPKHEKVEGLGGNLKYFKTAFVKNSISRDDLKMRITRECTEMLCLREGIFEEIDSGVGYRIFSTNDRIMAVYSALERDGMATLKKDLDKIKGEKILYCFTLDPLGLDKNDFADWHGVNLEPIPQKILDIYEQIYEY